MDLREMKTGPSADSEHRKDEDRTAATSARGGVNGGAREEGLIGLAAGPLGAMLAAGGAGHAGNKIAQRIGEAPEWGVYMRHFADQFRCAGYYRSGFEWQDYRPAYHYGYEHYTRNPGRPFDDIAPDLRRNWGLARAGSRLTWEDACEAVRDGWDYLSGNAPSAAGSDYR